MVQAVMQGPWDEARPSDSKGAHAQQQPSLPRHAAPCRQLLSRKRRRHGRQRRQRVRVERGPQTGSRRRCPQRISKLAAAASQQHRQPRQLSPVWLHCRNSSFAQALMSLCSRPDSNSSNVHHVQLMAACIMCKAAFFRVAAGVRGCLKHLLSSSQRDGLYHTD